MDLARTARLTLAVTGTLLLATGCSQVVSGTPVTAPTSVTQSTVDPHGFPTTMPALSSLLESHPPMRTARVRVSYAAGGKSLANVAIEKLHDGVIDAMDKRESVSGRRARVIVIGSRAYAKLPADSSVAHHKPWIELSASTSDPNARSLYEQLMAERTAGAALPTNALSVAGEDLRLVDVGRRKHTRIAEYTFTLDMANLPADMPGLAEVRQAGVTSVPMRLWVDKHGYARRIIESMVIAGHPTQYAVHLSRINRPVHIVPPPRHKTERVTR